MSSNVCSMSGFDGFICDNGCCIRRIWWCDGEDDCKDNSDENLKLCKKMMCTDLEFQCDIYRCIRNSWKCDGEKDCKDGTDEEYCTNCKFFVN